MASSAMEPRRMQTSVTAVIPTHNRPALVAAAVRSALRQTHRILEVIVVIDGVITSGPGTMGSTEETRRSLGAIDDPRLRVILLPTSVGGGEARNVGVRAARGAWIAFLDDDDEWEEEKIARQLEAAEKSAASSPVISSRVLADGPGVKEVWPRRLYQTGENMAEYLFCREEWTFGEALLQTSTLLAPRALLLRIPLRTGLKKHQDWDWLLRVSADPAVQIVQVPEALAVFRVEGDRKSVGRAPDWYFSFQWAREQRRYFSSRAFTSFLATECASQAGLAGAGVRDRLLLMRALIGEGSCTRKDALLFITFLLVPQRWRRMLRNWRRRIGSHPTPRMA